MDNYLKGSVDCVKCITDSKGSGIVSIKFSTGNESLAMVQEEEPLRE